MGLTLGPINIKFNAATAATAATKGMANHCMALQIK